VFAEYLAVLTRPLKTNVEYARLCHPIRLQPQITGSYTKLLSCGRSTSAKSQTVRGRRVLSIASRNDRRGLNHQDHAFLGRARTVHHSFWNDEALTWQKVDRAFREIDHEAAA